MKTRILLLIIIAGVIISAGTVSAILVINEPKTAKDCRFTYGKGGPELLACLEKIKENISTQKPSKVGPLNLRHQQCAELFDKIFDTWEKHVEGNYGGPGQPVLEPPSVAGLIAGWEGGQEFRDSDCRYTVNDWAYLVEHQEQVWGHVDWPKLEPFEYIPPKYGEANTSLEIIFGEPYENELLPITIREATRKANNFEEITIWNFAFVKNTNNTQKFEYWDFIPKKDRGSFDVVGGDFTSIIDESKEYTTFVNAIAYVSEIDCSDLGIQEIETGSPYTIPIQKDNYHVFVDHKKFGIFPDENGIYSFKMASFFDINNRSKDNITMISEEYEHCDWIDNIHPHLDPEYPVEPTFVDWKFKLK